MHLTGKGFPLFLTFDLDAETMWTARDPSYGSRPILMSQGAYGWKVRAPLKILALLAHYGIRATFFVPGIMCRPASRPDGKDSWEGGHEIAHHSYSHKWILNLNAEEEREEMEKGIEADKAGKRPKAARLAIPGGRDQRRHDADAGRIRVRLLIELLR